MRFEDRRDAGRRLARRLHDLAGRDDVVILALPRGGVPVAFEVASALGLPLDVVVVRKLGLPRHPELAMGAIASGGALALNRDVIAAWNVSQAGVDAVRREEQRELERRESLYRGARPPLQLAGRTAVVVDDGIATGATLRAAVAAVRAAGPARIVVAVPVAPPDARAGVEAMADAYVCLLEPDDFQAVGQYYVDFGQTGDDEVRSLLARAPLAAA